MNIASLALLPLVALVKLVAALATMTLIRSVLMPILQGVLMLMTVNIHQKNMEFMTHTLLTDNATHQFLVLGLSRDHRVVHVETLRGNARKLIRIMGACVIATRRQQ